MNRRELLGSAGAALLWVGCGAPAPMVVAPTPVPLRPDALRARLRDAVARLSAVYVHASALAVRRSYAVAAIDSAGASSGSDTVTSLVLAVRDASGRRRERATRDLTADRIDAEVRALLGGRGGRAAAVDFGAPHDAPGAAPPARRDWMPVVGELAARADAASSSRIVYRGCTVELDDAEVLLVAPGADRYERRVQGRVRVVLAAWRGSRLVPSVVSTAGLGPVDALALPDAALESAAAQALEPMTPGAAPSGERVLLLAPDVVAAIAEAGVADQMTADAWRRGAAARAGRGRAIAAESVVIVDDPTAATVARYAFDDEGRPSAPATLIDHGVLGGPLADGAGAAALGVDATSHARRPGAVGAMAARPSHVAVSPGTAGRADLVGAAGAGFLLEGVTAVRVEPSSWRLIARVARARRIADGVLTGHVHANLELRVHVPALLASVHGASAETATIGRRDVIDGAPLWRSATAPWWLARGDLVPAREPA
jgi:predicted Zn-dependent protease